MRKFSTLTVTLLFYLMVASSVTHAQTGKTIKKIAILETVDKDGTVSYAVKLMLRSNLAKAIASTPGYEAYDRTDMDAIMGEQNFQRTGLVSDDQIKRLGEMTGAAYILVAEAAKVDEMNIFITAKILNVETAKTEMTDNVLMSTAPADMQLGCESLAKKLLGLPADIPTKVTSNTNTSSNKRNTNPVQSEPKANEQPAAGSNEVGTLIKFPDGSRGIVFYNDGQHGLAVSLDAGEQPWHNVNRLKECIDVSTIPNNSDDDKNFMPGQGADYTFAISNQIGPMAMAAEWCTRHGNGWYLPSAGELVQLFSANDKKGGRKIDAAMKRYGGREIEGGWYWSSSESDKKEAVNINSSGWSSSEEKNQPNKVRAVRAF